VLSSAIASHLAKGENLENACRKGKLYIEKFLTSNQMF
jgi:hydroxymethylpyrimidine/phosphomethylpyrimidine kinase